MSQSGSGRTTQGRITGLDGLRGVAALVVLLYHASLVARPWLDPAAWTTLTETPLKLLLAGTESVLIFFVLSGIVVALPALRGGFDWARYYPARLLRLYVPVAAALLFAAALIVLLPRDRSQMPEGSWMRDAQASSVSPGALLSEASLMRPSYDIDNVLWSLRWEVFFSLLLPVFVWVALRSRRHSAAVAAGAALVIVIGRLTGNEALVYLPVFLLGTVIAVHLDDLRALAARPRVRPFLPILFAAACGLLIASWLARPITTRGGSADHVLWGLSAVGAALIVVLAIVWPRAARVLDTAPAQWLGRVSFSLYLIHAPILGTLGYALGPDRWWLACLLGIPLSLLLAPVFHRLVERPSHRLSRTVGAWCGARASAIGDRLGRAQPETG